MRYANPLDTLDKITGSLAIPALQHELRATIHKLRYPMRAILAKVPGDSVAERAEAIGVSRQTLYIWQDEKFRPIAAIADKISKLTGVPAEHIMELEDGNNDIGGTARKAAAKLAGRSQAAPGVDGRTGRGNRQKRVVVTQKRSRSVRARRKRTGG
jgi:DNA-binding XRE family transcriptional regulator